MRMPPMISGGCPGAWARLDEPVKTQIAKTVILPGAAAMVYATRFDLPGPGCDWPVGFLLM